MAAFEQISARGLHESDVVSHPTAVQLREQQSAGERVIVGAQQREQDEKLHSAAIEAVALALKTLSQRAVSGLSSVFTGAGLLVAYLLWDKIIGSPTSLQLVGLGIYGVFFLALEWIRRHK